MKDIRQKIQNYLKVLIDKNIENDDIVDTDIQLETNVGEKTELSTSDSVAIKVTENIDENVDTEEEMDFDDLTIYGDYS